MKVNKRIFNVLLIGCGLIFLSLISVVNAVIPQHTESFYTNDFAEVISSENENYIFENSKALADKTTAQVVVATVKSLDDRDINDYATDMFRQWGIGDKEKNNGLLILLAPNERKVRVEVGYGLEGKINDSKAGRLMDEYAVPCFKNDDWDGGITALYSAIVSEVYSEYGLEMPESVSDKVSAYNETREDSHMGTVVGIIIVAVVILFGGILPFVNTKKHPFDNDNDHDDWNDSGGVGGGFGGFDSGGESFGGFGGSSGGGGASRGF